MIRKQRLYFNHESASAELVCMDPEQPRRWTVTRVYSRRRGLGHSHGVLQKIVMVAEEQGWTLHLSVQAYGHPTHNMLDNKGLEGLYSQYGFVREDVLQRPPIRMVRVPGEIRQEATTILREKFSI